MPWTLTLSTSSKRLLIFHIFKVRVEISQLSQTSPIYHILQSAKTLASGMQLNHPHALRKKLKLS
jgi:hypothetical protein